MNYDCDDEFDGLVVDAWAAGIAFGAGALLLAVGALCVWALL